MEKRRARANKREAELRAESQRWRHDLERKALKRLRRRNRVAAQVSQDDHYRSAVLDSFSRGFVSKPDRPRGDVARISIPNVFSFSRNPKETISVLRRVVSAARTCRNPRIILDHRKVQDMGLGADTALGLIINEIQREASSSSRAYIKGYKPLNPSIRKMMEEVGSVRALHEFEERLEVDLKSSEKVFRFYHRFKSGAVDPFDADIVARTVRRFADHLNSCLNFVAKELTEEGMQSLLEYVSEVISNADEHSGSREWAAVGYVDTTKADIVYQCVIVSIGATMAGNFESLSRDSYAWESVIPYLNRHKEKGLFSPKWKVQDLLAVVALQGDISSRNESAEDTRGQGTVDLIEFFQSVRDQCEDAEESSEMHILTGGTLIRFDGTYRMARDPVSGRKVIAFNRENSLEDTPDPEYVRVLEGSTFPGVVISVRLPLGDNAIRSTDG